MQDVTLRSPTMPRMDEASAPGDDRGSERAAETTPTRPSGRSALPSVGSRILAFLAIVVAGAIGAFIGYGVTDLQCTGDCTVPDGIGALVGAVIAAGGTAVVVVLTLRAMGEWHTIQTRAPAPRDEGPPRVR